MSEREIYNTREIEGQGGRVGGTSMRFVLVQARKRMCSHDGQEERQWGRQWNMLACDIVCCFTCTPHVLRHLYAASPVRCVCCGLHVTMC